MKSISIVPYSDSLHALLSVSPHDYIVNSVYITPAYYQEGKDAGYIRNRSNTGILPACSIKDAVQASDLVLIPPGVSSMRTEDFDSVSQYQNELKYDVIDSMELKSRIKEYYIKTMSQYPDRDPISPGSIQEICIPVIAICSLFENSDSFEVLQVISNSLKVRGYVPLTVSFNELGVLYNNLVLSLGETINITETVLEINNTVLRASRAIGSDIVLVEFPTPIAEYSKHIHFDFGVLSYLLARSLHPDGIVLCTSLNLSSPDLIENICNSAALRLGAEWWSVHVGNQILHADNETANHKFKVLYDTESNSDERVQYINNYNIKAFNVFKSKTNLKSIIDSIETSFLSYRNGIVL